MRNKSFRRHQKRRIQKKAYKIGRLNECVYGIVDWHNAEENRRKWVESADSLPRCSCTMCGNQRKHFGRITRQEMFAKIKEAEDLGEYFGKHMPGTRQEILDTE